jgi:hypothetical protein
MADRIPPPRDVFEHFDIAGAELDARLASARSPDYWRRLAPAVSIASPGSSAPTTSAVMAPAVEEELADRFGREGYFVTPPLVPVEIVARLRATVRDVMTAGWPAVFAFVYDEFWSVSRLPALANLFSRVLGAGYRQSPFVWLHVVPGYRGAAGWPPHVDNTGRDLRLTVWIALTDATTDTGCMAIVPRHLAPSGDARWFQRASLEIGDVFHVLHASRPLPAPAGSVLAWDVGLLHWGAPRQAAGDPRVSLSMELVPSTASADVLVDTWPCAGAELPSFGDRLGVIASAIALYHANDPRARRFAPLADRLLADKR